VSLPADRRGHEKAAAGLRSAAASIRISNRQKGHRQLRFDRRISDIGKLAAETKNILDAASAHG
jgi:hypothetical protein